MSKRQAKERRAIVRMAQNILAVYLSADELTRAAGRVWYAEESARLADLARRTERPLDAIAGAAAAISPGMRWEFVPAHVRALIGNRLHKVPTYSREFVRRALACLDGAEPTQVITGPKTRAFYRLLASAGGTDDVVIDGHALNIARGVPCPVRGNVPAAARVTVARYRQAAAAYREVAELVGEAPHSVQAACWVYWRAALDIATRT
jgi:hypothetical protein